MRWVVVAGLAALAIAAAVILGSSGGARSQPAPGDAPRAVDAAPGPLGDAPSPLTVAVRAGQALRIDGPSGPIQVWRPAGYRPETAATVVYVHGFYQDVDVAWRDDQLAEQFASSAINAVFIAPEAPVGLREPVAYPDLGEVLRLVETALGEPRPSGPLIVIGHSGGYRTLLRWIDHPLIDTVMLIDALYGDLDDFARWLLEGPSTQGSPPASPGSGQAPARRLVTVGDDTLRWTEELARTIPGTVEVDRIPPEPELWPADARTARHLYIRSQLGHMAQVTAGILLPMLLRLEAVEVLADAPWQHPLGALPALPPDAAPRGRGRR